MARIRLSLFGLSASCQRSPTFLMTTCLTRSILSFSDSACVFLPPSPKTLFRALNVTVPNRVRSPLSASATRPVESPYAVCDFIGFPQ